MKYKTAKVISHPRAGSHYLARLLNINFFHKENYLDLYAGHSKSHLECMKNPGTAVFYMKRNNTDTIKSMFVLRNRFGLVADNIEEFKTKKLCDMHNKNIKSEAIFNGKLVTDVDTYFASINMTIDEYLDDHKKYFYKPGLFVVDYSALQEPHFEPCMRAIALYLGSDKTEFIQEGERVGWYDKNEHKEKFS